MLSKFTFGYISISILVLIGYLSENMPFQYVTRPLLCAWLLYFYYSEISNQKSKETNISVYVALFSALIGDIIFIEDYLITMGIGTSFYLVMYLGYIRVFQSQGTRMLFKDMKTFLKVLPYIAFIFICFGFLVLRKVQDNYLPISMFYTVIVTIFMVISILRETNLVSYRYGLAASFVFVVASMIAAYKSFIDRDLSDVGTITMYCAGQYFVMMAIVIHQEPKSKIGKSIN
jgi:hypothetical protein